MAHRIQEPKVETPEIRVLARGTALVPDYAALIEARTKRFVGWAHDPALGEKFKDPDTQQVRRTGGFVKQTDGVVTIPADSPYMTEYVRHVREGDLWAADPESAAACGVAFEPGFFEEHPKTTAKHVKQDAAPKAGATPDVHESPTRVLDVADIEEPDGTRVPSADKTESK